MFKVSNLSRIVLALGALSLLGMLKLPIWKIYLTAPQYPEGLEMKIWHNTLTGDVQVISALNHYIGMRAISVDMFPEFEYLGTIIMVVVGVCLLLALIGRWWSILTYFLVLVVGDSAALYDFWRWGYDYGHNLNPTAPIIIPDMVYQPPVIGYKKLLNFEAWSLPDAGGWILMVVSALAFLAVVYEWWKNRRKKRTAGTSNAAVYIALFMSASLLSSCTSGPRPIDFGRDNCDFCKMTMMDHHFGSEIITKKGKVYKFDDLNCMVKFESEGTVPENQIAKRYVINYTEPGMLITAENAVFLQNENLKTPMASGLAAFADRAGLEQTQSSLGGVVLHWEQVKTAF